MESFLLDCLDEIESRETRFLVWGIVDISFSQEELEDLIDQKLDAAPSEVCTIYFEAKQVLSDLSAKCFIHSFLANDEMRYRSRMAETVRLASRLRQLFPKHEGTNAWQQAPTLVADYRFIRRKRFFPKRDLDLQEVLDNCRDADCGDRQIKILESLCTRDDTKFKLAGFQSKATIRILDGLNKRYDRGTIVCAGTGSGKTLSFYWPALTHISSLLLQSVTHHYWVKVLAIYPRNELLKDQFSEVYAEARRLDDFLREKQRRKIIIGAFFGPTPFSSDYVSKSENGWSRVHGGYACVYLQCPTQDCGGQLIWSDSDLKNKRERLVCNACKYEVCEDEIVLTRTRLNDIPPDILFTTTEMLNQRMSDSWCRHLFGLGPRAHKKPGLVLLDEVHTYSGTHGAQVAYLLRRWRSLVNSKVSFVGLSATLREANLFFARLIGYPEWFVDEVSPRFDEMTSSGAEYMLALRGDPVSRRSLLSTTIQTAMLIGRCLDPSENGISDGVFGKKTFVFTDDIDVTNRLYFNLLDAEGRNSWGEIDNANHPKGGLAYLREKDGSNFPRYQYGQDWRFCEQIGHELDQRLKVGRTSSQDSGVDLSADMIVATSSLEVGFNDPEVGAVLQHKSPRDPAQFLQRKGRAGRSRSMRPWTIVSLSDYGRDRLAYQGYDVLFDPELSPRQLAISNRYVQRMQAVNALIDFLGMRLESERERGSVWKELSFPLDEPNQVKADRRRQAIIDELSSLLKSNPALDDFSRFLMNDLQIDEDTLVSLLWEFPRPLLTTVVPTALRRVSSNWRGTEPYNYNSPLPDFIPGNLFSDLNLPEVVVQIPPQDGFDSKRPPVMPVLQAMKEFAPGRVSRRFGVAHKYIRHWLVDNLEKELTEQKIEISNVADAYDLGFFEYLDSYGENTIKVLRPHTLRPTLPPKTVLDSSNAYHLWRTQIVAPNSNEQLDVPGGTGWGKVVNDIRFYVHNHSSPVEMRRFSLGAQASIAFKNGNRLETNFSFVDKGEKVGVGFSFTSDAIVFDITTPCDLWKDSCHLSDKWRSLRTTRYFDLAWQDDSLSTVSNPFAREWLARVFLSALVTEALTTEKSLQEVCPSLVSGDAPRMLALVLETIFQSTTIENQDEGGGEDRLRQEILEHLNCQLVREEIAQLASCLWDPIDPSWQEWLQNVYACTIAAALFRTVENICPDLNTEDLLVDIQPSCEEEGCIYQVWISENTTGGCGLIEALVQRIGEDPRQFFNLIESSLDSAEFELIDSQLTRLLGIIVDDKSPLHASFKALRESDSIKETESALESLRQNLSLDGFVQFHSFMVSLNNRILRPGSNQMSDQLLYDIITEWKSQECRLGIEIDARIIAYVLSQKMKIEDVLAVQLGPITNNQLLSWRFNSIYGLLWPRGRVVRQANINLYNPFSEFAHSERLLVNDRLLRSSATIDVTQGAWQEEYLKKLQGCGGVKLCCGHSEKTVLKDVINFIMTNPVEDDYLLLYPRLRSVRQKERQIEIEVELAEAIQ